MPEDFKPPDYPQPASAISYFPYFDSSYLAVAASLNGGNVFATFVEMLSAWMKELGMLCLPDDFMKLNVGDVSGEKLIKWPLKS